MAVGRRGRSAVRIRVAAHGPQRPLACDRGRRRASHRPAAGVPGAAAAGAAGTDRVLPRAGAADGRARARRCGGDHASPPRSPEWPGRRQAPWRPLGSRRRSRPAASHGPQTPADSDRRHGHTDAGGCGAGTVARLPGEAAAARRGPPRAGRVRTDAVGQVGRDRDPEHPRVARTSDRRLDQTRPPRRHPHHPRPARRGARVRPLRPLEPARATPGPRWPAPTPGTGRSRPRSGWRQPARSTPAR